MFEVEEFKIFGFEHLLTIFLIICFSVLFPFLLKNLKTSSKSKIALGLAIFIILNEVIKPFYYPALYPERYDFLSTLPLHLCNLASLFIAIFFISKIRFFFNLSFFWGISGVLMALTQPDYPYDFPHLHFILFNFNHALLLFSIFFAFITLNNIPDFKSYQDTIFYSIPIVLVVFSINLLINFLSKNTVANYMYLIEFPLGENLTRFMPDPPFHVLIFIPIALLLFSITYLPFYFKDKFYS
ncbi:TIGR02206 family membrane protein [SAR86 cluster bacterium]|nr:TIGR02206 family membrane protein [SAR86 cluster bacterium]